MSETTPPLVAFARLIDSLNARLGRICAWVPVFLVAGTTLVVILRYGFGIGATALQEAVMYSHALVFMGAAAWALQQGAHVRVDILYQRFSTRTKEVVNMFGTLVLLLPTCGFLLWLSWSYVGAAWASHGVFVLFAVLFMFTGVQLVGMGLLGEYLGRMYNDVRARPRFFIERIVRADASRPQISSSSPSFESIQP